MQTPRTVLITGCSTGIGRATALRLALAGHTVHATARKVESLAALEEVGCHVAELDVTDEGSMTRAVARVIERHGAVDALINNAGYSQSGAVETIGPEDLRRQFETNVFGLVRMCQLVLPGMRERGNGRIVNISSMGANFVFPGGGAYHATKYAVEALSDALRFEVSGFGIGVTLVQPGLIRTGFATTAGSSLPPSQVPYTEFNRTVATQTVEVYEKGPMARLGGEPDDVARAVEKVITAKRAPVRVRVTASASVLTAQRRLMSDRMWDRFLRTQFTPPSIL